MTKSPKRALYASKCSREIEISLDGGRKAFGKRNACGREEIPREETHTKYGGDAMEIEIESIGNVELWREYLLRQYRRVSVFIRRGSLRSGEYADFSQPHQGARLCR